MEQIGEDLVALLKSGQDPHQVIDARLAELDECGPACGGVHCRGLQRARAGVCNLGGVPALAGELRADELHLVHERRRSEK